MNLSNEGNRRNRKHFRSITITLAIVLVAVWFVLFFYKYANGGVNSSELLDEISSNLLGILPPLIIFNIIYERLAKDYIADEMSKHILETLTGNTEIMDTFKEDVRRNFIKSTIKSLVSADELDMVYGVLKPFISDKRYDMKMEYKYFIDVKKFYNSQDIGSKLFSPYNYYIITESLSYTRVLSVQGSEIYKFRIGFLVDATSLEKELSDNNYLFRERLKIRDEELQQLILMPDSEKRRFVVNCLQFKLLIDNCATKISNVCIGDFGISLDFVLEPPVKKNRFKVEIGFRMPQIKKSSDFLVSLPEPTFCPEIVFTYSPNVSKVTAYQFLNGDPTLIEVAAAFHGRIALNPHEWIYPTKGAVFILEDIDEDNVAKL